ncbi:MAG: D-glycero-beta-D-manno-heptose 1,7-bisphosphate 7-phosphatase [Magnetococcales bacterium]|nr:D-glycero-beta-D-manno-heptose 1,7-bisphosphate 7-phosphatase [Magnetococcales bacterium]
MTTRVLFLDRDGVINEDHGYVHRVEQFDFIEGIFDLTRAACRSGYRVVVVTNQSGIARGYYTETEFHRLTDWMRAAFETQGARIEAVYYCPYHPTEGIGAYRREDSCRKPAPGMLLQAARELEIDLGASLLIGDRVSDIQAAAAAGVGRSLLLVRPPERVPENPSCPVVASLSEAIPWLT